MENLWMKSHNFILDSKAGDYYLTGGSKIQVVKRTPKRIHFSDGKIITVSKSKYGFYYFSGKFINQILRDVEGYFLYKLHDADLGYLL